MTSANLERENHPFSGNGKRVIVRCFGDIGRVNILLEMLPSAAFVCSPERYDEILNGRNEPPLAGFPINDVYEFDELAAEAIKDGRPVQWRRLSAISSSAT